MHWVIQHNMFNEEGFNRLLSALVRLGSRFTLVKVLPFVHEVIPVGSEALRDAPDDVFLAAELQPLVLPKRGAKAVVMGTYTLAEIAKKMRWKPGSFHNKNFDYDLQSYYWDMLNGQGWSGALGNFPEHRDRFFIRPVHDSKSFIGQVVDWPSFVKWRAELALLTAEDNPTVTGDTEIVVSEVKEIWREYRLWVVDEKVVTASLYKMGTIKRYEEGAPPWVLEFAQKQIEKWVPARAFVMDVAETLEGLKVIEVNNLNCAGFYKGDMQKLVAAIEAME